MPIHLLSPDIASQIAAGEVIERPSSVVKELIENSLDAHATAISVSIEQAGRSLIEVADDGSGIPAEELQLAVARHATSKLSNADDLFRIGTLGFRGEALASIAAVSRMTITSRVTGAPHGARLVAEAGRADAHQEIGAPVGTQVRVEYLFHNVPARLKFLKKDLTERRLTETVLTRYALAYPGVRFSVSMEGSPALNTAGDRDRRAILAALYGLDSARQMLEVEAADEGMSLEGFISPTTLTRSNRRDIMFFVNGRWIQDLAITTALTQAYHSLLMVGRFPMAALFLELPREDVDVNVHPAKAEVRFRQPDQVFAFVQRAVRRGLLAYSPVPLLTSRTWGVPSSAAGGEEAQSMRAENAWREPATPSAVVTPEFWQPASAGRTEGRASMPVLRLVGQIGATYLVAEGPDGLYLVDQHAAHERILFEKLMEARAAHSLVSQDLLQPVLVSLTPAQAVLLESQAESLRNLGFDVHAFGSNAFQVRAMPAFLAGRDPEPALRAVIEDFEEDENPLGAEVETRMAARVCKRLAVRSGQLLTPAEQQGLLSDLEACTSPRTCPHGRPTMIHLSVDLLERQFGRRGPI